MTAISNLDFGEKKMEFRKLPIDSLTSASYNPRKKLKPGDSEFEKIKNSITEFEAITWKLRSPAHPRPRL